ncbi:hypothetical protein SLS62_000727 [Diatrype stigma]|uniref:Methyltransferase-domain-containing protein n=1 Tax=Diatrype stigma TaxID=117547 RepID=A0AAN9VBP8_9PEZI
MGWNPKAPKTFRDTTAVRTFKIPRDPAKGGGELSIHITEPDLKAQGLSLETWAASSVQAGLIQRLTESQVTFPPDIITAYRGSDGDVAPPQHPQTIIPILELGAGTGMVGISAAVKYGLSAVLTDLGPIAPGLAANAALNRDSLPGSGAETPTMIFSGTLDWSQPADLSFYYSPPPESETETEKEPPHDTTPTTAQRKNQNPFEGTAEKAHLVLAADTIYSDEHPPLLAATVLHWLRRDHPDARLVMCLPLRACYLEELRDLWQRLEAGGLECVEDGQEMADQGVFDDECLCEWSIWRWKRQDSEDEAENANANDDEKRD